MSAYVSHLLATQHSHAEGPATGHIYAARHALYLSPTAPSNNSRVTSHLMPEGKKNLSSVATRHDRRPHRSHIFVSQYKPDRCV